jgi:hypothetical protein
MRFGLAKAGKKEYGRQHLGGKERSIISGDEKEKLQTLLK